LDVDVFNTFLSVKALQRGICLDLPNDHSQETRKSEPDCQILPEAQIWKELTNVKKLAARLASFLLVLGLAAPANAVLDGGGSGGRDTGTPMYVAFYRDTQSCEVPVRNKGGRLYTQVQAIGDCLGVGVDWDEDTKTARIFGQPSATKWGDLRLRPTLEDRYLQMYDSDGSYIGRFDLGSQAPFIYEGRSYLPLRVLIEAFRVRVEWVPANQTQQGRNPEVHILTDQDPMPYDIGSMADYVYFSGGHFHVADEPSGGWPVTPAAFIATVNAVNNANTIAGYAQDTHGRVLEAIYEAGNGRLTRGAPVTTVFDCQRRPWRN
jgi:hypothetical protein